MIRVCFICHGNICRSTMAQFVLQDLVNRAGYTDNFYIDSMATSTEEIGNGPHHGTVAKLRQVGVPVLEHYAKQVRKSDYRNFDHIIGMDQWNYRNMMRIFGKDPEQKVSLLWTSQIVPVRLRTHGIRVILMKRIGMCWMGVKDFWHICGSRESYKTGKVIRQGKL